MDSSALDVRLSNGGSDLDGILALQRANLRTRLAEETALNSGFVTVEHTREILAQMHTSGASVVARSGELVVGYALTMTQECRRLLPVLEPMFERFGELTYAGRALADWSYYVMGQICVATAQRGSGIFDALYAAHREHFASRYQLLLTEISARNQRSLRAHARVRFTELTRFVDATDEWVIVALALRA
jgi:predicted GNAT superfamily acetyltransferase